MVDAIIDLLESLLKPCPFVRRRFHYQGDNVVVLPDVNDTWQHNVFGLCQKCVGPLLQEIEYEDREENRRHTLQDEQYLFVCVQHGNTCSRKTLGKRHL